MKTKQIFTYILLFTLLFFKVSTFHVFSHSENEETEIENCILCEVTFAQQQEVLIAPTTIDFKVESFTAISIPLPIQTEVPSTSYFYFRHTSRPPPARFA
ncbi:hypothetical protein BUL40_07505 [Croceivirga radicis]|uniref:Uncharacterized protein n=1 Tax=Croceivirga radicis TaxID=1929488 RepID=A0A1V6LRY0_9FLAO|nr:hypothetical protein [Croceivirga radicis]OQD42932.1 hypothetical protein BUL40_07505 [Croceivirga radicis]